MAANVLLSPVVVTLIALIERLPRPLICLLVRPSPKTTNTGNKMFGEKHHAGID